MADEVNDLTNCPVCFESFSEPKKLSCDHTLCSDCVNRIREGSVIQCPKCDLYSDMDNVQPDFRLLQFLKALNKQAEVLTHREESLAVNGQYSCELCQKTQLSYKCENCDQWMCRECKVIHLRAKISKSHAVKSLAEEIERIKTSLRIREVSFRLNEKFRDFQTAIKSVEQAVNQIRDGRANSLKTLNNLRQICISEINNFFESLDSKICHFIDSQIQEYETEIHKLQLKLQEIDSNCRTIQQLMKDDNPEIIFQGEAAVHHIRQAAESVVRPEVDLDKPCIQIVKNKEWHANAAILELTGGVIAIQTTHVTPALQDIRQIKWKRKKAAGIPEYPFALRAIRNELWCCHRAGITVYTGELGHQRAIPVGRAGSVLDIAPVNNGDLVAATRNGLYHLNATGEEIISVIDNTDYFSSVQVNGNTVYAANCNAKSEIRVYQFAQSWTHRDTVTLTCGRGHWVTLSTINDDLKACCASESKLYELSRNGKSHKVHKTCGKGGNREGVRLNCPYACGECSKDAILIADCNNDAVRLMQAGGDWGEVALHPRVEKPCSVVLLHGNGSSGLYVVSNAYPYTLYKYASNS